MPKEIKKDLEKDDYGKYKGTVFTTSESKNTNTFILKNKVDVYIDKDTIFPVGKYLSHNKTINFSYEFDNSDSDTDTDKDSDTDEETDEDSDDNLDTIN